MADYDPTWNGVNGFHYAEESDTPLIDESTSKTFVSPLGDDPDLTNVVLQAAVLGWNDAGVVDDALQNVTIEFVNDGVGTNNALEVAVPNNSAQVLEIGILVLDIDNMGLRVPFQADWPANSGPVQFSENWGDLVSSAGFHHVSVAAGDSEVIDVSTLVASMEEPFLAQVIGSSFLVAVGDGAGGVITEGGTVTVHNLDQAKTQEGWILFQKVHSMFRNFTNNA